MGTSDPLIDAALREADWLGRLARSLVKDAERAEDAVQETWVAALEHAGEARSSPRGWLGAILRNELRQEARARGRREAHEQRVELARSEPSAHDVSERLEVQALLLESVRALEEPYRATLVARFFDGLPPRAIARRDGVPVRTVNTRIERGLAQLRARLDGRFGGERSAWLRALLPFAGSQWSGWRLGEGLAMGATLKGLAVGVVVGALWLGWTWFEPKEQDGSGLAVVPRPSLDARGGTRSASAPVGEPGAEIASAPAESGRAALGTPDASGVCRIRAVSAGSHAPVPGARVWVQREEVTYDSRAWKEAVRRSNDVEAALQDGLGTEFLLDEHGEVLVPRPARALSLAVALGELHGDGELLPEAAECVVELKPYRSLAVEVVDRSGLPVPGAHVALFSGEFDPFASSWTWPTDAAGRAWIPKLEREVGERERITVVPAGGVPSEPARVQFTLESAPREPVRLVVGDLGHVVVQLTDARGEALTANGTAVLRLSRGERQDAEICLPIFDGHAEATCVGLGLAFEVMGSADGYDSEWREVRGPTEADRESLVLVPVQRRQPFARGRVHGIPALLLDSPGAEVALCATSRELHCSFYASVREGVAFEASIPASEGLDELAEPWLVKLSRTDGKEVRTLVRPTLAADGAGLDFGDVAFPAVQELVRARVVDEHGAPVGSAGIELETSLGPSATRADAAGECLVVGSRAELPLEVRARRDGSRASAWATVVEPGGETTLVLRAGATLEASVLLPERVRLDELELALRSEVGDADEPLRDRTVEAGRIRFRNCEPGLATLRVTDSERRVLFERAGIELVAGRTTELEPLDLRDALHPFTLTFERASGEPWRGGHLEVRQPDGTLTTWTAIDAAGHATFLSLQTSVDLWAVGRGTRALFFAGVHDGDRLVVPATPAVELQLAHTLALPAPPLALLLRAERVRPVEVEFETYDDVDLEEALVHDDGRARLEQSWPGDYALSWFVRRADTGVEFPVTQAERQTVTLPDSPAAPLVEARLTAEELARAVRAAGGG